jgi:crotonobetainyl-CoA:carnitine CoA-transferase CaiB-like acyl-CoA transferase
MGYDACRAVKPDILYCNNYMYGAEGPLAHFGGIDPHGQSSAGLEWEQGPVAEGNPPIWIRYGHGDVAAAMSSVAALLIALHHRDRTGEGQQLWASIFHSTMLYTADSWLAADGTPSPRPTLDREQLGLSALYRLYETQDGWLQLAAVRDEHWDPLCQVLRIGHLVDDPRFATESARSANRRELTTVLEEALMADLAINWRRRLRAAGVPCEVSVDMMDGEHVLFDDELVRLGLVAEYTHPLLGRTRQFGNLVTFDGTPGVQDRPTPRVGEDTRALLERLGYDEFAIQDLYDRRVVTWPGDDYAFQV